MVESVFNGKDNVQHKQNVRKAKNDSARANKGRPAKRKRDHRAHKGGIYDSLDFLLVGNICEEEQPRKYGKEHDFPQDELKEARLFAAKESLDKKRMAHKVQGD